jgi:predicted neutral ceramidase superfamily lipid hydrolase
LDVIIGYHISLVPSQIHYCTFLLRLFSLLVISISEFIHQRLFTSRFSYSFNYSTQLIAFIIIKVDFSIKEVNHLVLMSLRCVGVLNFVGRTLDCNSAFQLLGASLFGRWLMIGLLCRDTIVWCFWVRNNLECQWFIEKK